MCLHNYWTLKKKFRILEFVDLVSTGCINNLTDIAMENFLLNTFSFSDELWNSLLPDLFKGVDHSLRQNQFMVAREKRTL